MEESSARIPVGNSAFFFCRNRKYAWRNPLQDFFGIIFGGNPQQGILRNFWRNLQEESLAEEIHGKIFNRKFWRNSQQEFLEESLAENSRGILRISSWEESSAGNPEEFSGGIPGGILSRNSWKNF